MKVINKYKNVIQKEYSVKLDSNESYRAMSKDSIEEAFEELRTNNFNRYPDTNANMLKESYAKVVNVESENLIVGNGSDEMLALVINSIISKGKTLFTLDPDFSMYDFYVTLNEGKIIKYKTDSDGSFTVENFIKAAKEAKPDLIMFSNPNNPTGFALNPAEIKVIIESFPKTRIVIDEAYYEFYGQTAIPFIREHDNLIITRTLSKAWGLAALRVGFLIASESLVKELSQYKVPYNVNGVSQCIATKVLQYPAVALEGVLEIIEERQKLYDKLKSLENNFEGLITFYTSRANFIYGRSKYVRFLESYMEKQGALIRYFKDDSFRITVGNPLENDIIVSIINSALETVGDENERKTW